jgi:hypothetical protein
MKEVVNFLGFDMYFYSNTELFFCLKKKRENAEHYCVAKWDGSMVIPLGVLIGGTGWSDAPGGSSSTRT